MLTRFRKGESALDHLVLPLEKETNDVILQLTLVAASHPTSPPGISCAHPTGSLGIPQRGWRRGHSDIRPTPNRGPSRIRPTPTSCPSRIRLAHDLGPSRTRPVPDLGSSRIRPTLYHGPSYTRPTPGRPWATSPASATGVSSHAHARACSLGCTSADSRWAPSNAQRERRGGCANTTFRRLTTSYFTSPGLSAARRDSSRQKTHESTGHSTPCSFALSCSYFTPSHVRETASILSQHSPQTG